MFVRISNIFIVLALVAMLGAHWAFLQTVAWTSMLADNLCTQSLTEAVSRTFDGDHPCPLCQAIAAGKKSEKKNAFDTQNQKLEFPPLSQKFVLIAPTERPFSPWKTFSVKSTKQKPLLPPPRSFFI
ncbi:MAG: hypothetical protein ABSE48_08455 [Verrucomicrobiota bacterium]